MSGVDAFAAALALLAVGVLVLHLFWRRWQYEIVTDDGEADE